MKKLLKKVLTDKSARDAAGLEAFAKTAANVGAPWN